MKIYEVRHPKPIVTGAGEANVFWLWPTRLVFSVSAPGRYRVKVRWSPYWKTSQGCVWRGSDGTVRLQATQAGLVQLGVDLNVSRGLETLTGLQPAPRLRASRRATIPAPMTDDARSLTDQLDELGTQLDWVREYL